MVEPPAVSRRRHPRAVAALISVQCAKRVAPSLARELLDQQQLSTVVALAIGGTQPAGARAREGRDLALPALVAGRVEVAGDYPRRRAVRRHRGEHALERTHLHLL